MQFRIHLAEALNAVPLQNSAPNLSAIVRYRKEERVMTSDEGWHRINLARTVAIALGMATVLHPIIATADTVTSIIVVPPRSTETAPGGTVILRGSGWPKPDAEHRGPERTPISYPPTISSGPPQLGVDRNFDTSDFDRSGLTRP